MSDDIKQAVTEGVLAGVREASAKLFEVAKSGDNGCSERARAGLVRINETATKMLDIIDEVFRPEGGSQKRGD